MKSLHAMLAGESQRQGPAHHDLEGGPQRETKRYEARQGKYGIYANWKDLFFEWFKICSSDFYGVFNVEISVMNGIHMSNGHICE